MARLVAAAASSAQALEKLQQFTVSPIIHCLFRNHLKFLFGFVWFVMALPILVGAVIPSVVYAVWHCQGKIRSFLIVNSERVVSTIHSGLLNCLSTFGADFCCCCCYHRDKAHFRPNLSLASPSFPLQQEEKKTRNKNNKRISFTKLFHSRLLSPVCITHKPYIQKKTPAIHKSTKTPMFLRLSCWF